MWAHATAPPLPRARAAHRRGGGRRSSSQSTTPPCPSAPRRSGPSGRRQPRLGPARENHSEREGREPSPRRAARRLHLRNESIEAQRSAAAQAQTKLAEAAHLQPLGLLDLGRGNLRRPPAVRVRRGAPRANPAPRIRHVPFWCGPRPGSSSSGRSRAEGAGPIAGRRTRVSPRPSPRAAAAPPHLALPDEVDPLERLLLGHGGGGVAGGRRLPKIIILQLSSSSAVRPPARQPCSQSPCTRRRGPGAADDASPVAHRGGRGPAAGTGRHCALRPAPRRPALQQRARQRRSRPTDGVGARLVGPGGHRGRRVQLGARSPPHWAVERHAALPSRDEWCQARRRAARGAVLASPSAGRVAAGAAPPPTLPQRPPPSPCPFPATPAAFASSFPASGRPGPRPVAGAEVSSRARVAWTHPSATHRCCRRCPLPPPLRGHHRQRIGPLGALPASWRRRRRWRLLRSSAYHTAAVCHFRRLRPRHISQRGRACADGVFGEHGHAFALALKPLTRETRGRGRGHLGKRTAFAVAFAAACGGSMTNTSRFRYSSGVPGTARTLRASALSTVPTM